MVRAVADRLGLPAVELDALRHGPNWTPRLSFVDYVREFNHVFRWIWRTLPQTAQRMRKVLSGPDGARLTIVRLWGHHQVDRWLESTLRTVAERAET
ncbi:hypothetical protein GCM10012275_46750 [Longimycelium tulufanense]|uniref:Uncharacterized protein n=2 Tax=Longimycelium tulufanense TaxID=907463 RepID=A0A8J3CI55_9PSEU|nr:hypothetical protein GCM10012275_46750 [Longimycelium tulufanense]